MCKYYTKYYIVNANTENAIPMSSKLSNTTTVLSNLTFPGTFTNLLSLEFANSRFASYIFDRRSYGLSDGFSTVPDAKYTSKESHRIHIKNKIEGIGHRLKTKQNCSNKCIFLKKFFFAIHLIAFHF